MRGGCCKEFGVIDVNTGNFTGTARFDEVLSFWKKLRFQIHRQSALVEAWSDGTPVTCYRAELLLPAWTPMAAGLSLAGNESWKKKGAGTLGISWKSSRLILTVSIQATTGLYRSWKSPR